MANRKLGDVAEIVMGQSPPGASCNDEGQGIPLLNGPTEFGSHHPTPVQFTSDARKHARTGDLLFCVRGSTTGKMNWADQDYAIGRGIAAVRHKSDLALQPLVRGVVEHCLPALLAQATGSTFPNISGGQLTSVPFPDLTETEEIAIARFLGAFDDKIELNERMNSTFDEMARALFKSWFVDFDPVRAKAEGRQPSHMDAATAALFPDSFEDSALGPIPVGWRTELLEVAAEVIPGRSYKSSELSESPVALATLKSVKRGGGYQEGGLKPYTGPYREGQVLGVNDIVIAKTDLTQGAEVIGRAARVPSESRFKKLIASLDLAIVRPKKSSLGRPYLYEALRDARFVDHALGFTNGTTVLHLGKDALPTYELVLAPGPLADRFVTVVQPMQDLAESNVAESRTLAELRDTLLPKLISGEIRVSEAAREVEAAI